MGKIWLVKSKYGKKAKVYNSERTFLAAISSDDKRKVFIFEESEMGIAGEMYNSLVKGKERDDQLKVVLGEVDKYEEAIYSFKEMFIKMAPEINEKKHILHRLKLTGLNKKEFSTMASNHHFKEFLLFGISDSVEWYQTLLRCHNFTKLPESYVAIVQVEKVNRWDNGIKRVRRTTGDTRKENFRLAKESLKKKNNKKQLEILENEKQIKN